MDDLTANAKETEEVREEGQDSPLIDSTQAGVKRFLQRAKERGYVTYDELNKVLPPDQVSSEKIEDTMALLPEMGINVVDSEETEEVAESKAVATTNPTAVATTTSDDELGRTDDPVRMYFREMGSIALLSRQGEVAIAKRIEAGRETMIGGVCESPLTMQAIVQWRDALKNDHVLLRDIIDLDATYGGGPTSAADLKGDNAGEVKAEDDGEDDDSDSGKENESDKQVGEGQEGQDGHQASRDDDDDDEGASISLSAMEEALKPNVLELFDKIASSYKKLDRLQEQQVEARLKTRSSRRRSRSDTRSSRRSSSS